MNDAEVAAEQAPAERVRVPDDAGDLGQVAALVARAGLPLSAAEIAELVEGYRYDRRGFERLRSMLVAEDEPAHVFRASHGRGVGP